ncbi:MAG: four helix bundle protein [Patescibacteria group bacterium]
MSIQKNRFDLEDRTTLFSAAIVRFVKIIPRNIVNTPMIKQLIRSGTSICANYCEANDAESKNDFIHKLCISKKEARETQH